MSIFSTTSLLTSGLTLALSLAFLLILLWYDLHQALNRFFAVFLMAVTTWNTGLFVSLAIAFVDPQSPLLRSTITVMEMGFAGSSIAVYALTAQLVGVHSRRFQILVFVSLSLIVAYHGILALSNAPIQFETLSTGFYKYRFELLSAAFYLSFAFVALFLALKYRRKITPTSLFVGIIAFVVGQSLGFLNPELEVAAFSVSLAGVSALIISFALLRRQMITPLSERIQQMESVHQVSLAITQHIALQPMLDQIVLQAKNWMGADAAAIFLANNNDLTLVTGVSVPVEYIGRQISFGQGLIGISAAERRSVLLENYSRDWAGADDLPLARETFGAVICVPLLSSAQTIGLLLVISGKQGRLFSQNDVQRLELLAAQASVAITHSRLFSEQQQLASDMQAARHQLEAVLSGTENPVIAVNRQLVVIFANPAAHVLLAEHASVVGADLRQLAPKGSLPGAWLPIARHLKCNRTYVSEICIQEREYQCHISRLGQARTQGWVIVLNDISELKELDRMKGDMIRLTSHDLKNPLQAAMANLELLQDDLSHIAVNQSDVQESISAIDAQLQRMNRIIGGVLDLERVKTGSGRMDVYDVKALVSEAYSEVQHLFETKQIGFLTTFEDMLPNVIADSEQFVRALVNLLENAVKFSNNGGEVRIEARSVASTVIISITDTGIGIPPEHLPHLFERFWRGGPRGQAGAEHIPGTGLGLSLVKAIVDNHQGTLQVSSEVGRGTTISISIQSLTSSTSPTNNIKMMESI